MKTILTTAALAAIASTIAFADVIEKTTTTTGGATSVTTTTGTGTITEYAPGSSFVVKETSGPVHYRYGKSVTYVTKSGKTLSDDEVRTRIRVGAPVTVHYGSEGSERVINRVIVDE